MLLDYLFNARILYHQAPLLLEMGPQMLITAAIAPPPPTPSSTPYIICSRTATMLILAISGQAVKICLHYISFINYMGHFTS